MHTCVNTGKNNTNWRAGKESLIAQGDFPVTFRSIETRPGCLEQNLNEEGSIQEGTSFERDMYQLDSILDDEGTVNVFGY